MSLNVACGDVIEIALFAIELLRGKKAMSAVVQIAVVSCGASCVSLNVAYGAILEIALVAIELH